MGRRIAIGSIITTVFLPLPAFALTTAGVLGFFNLIVGVMLSVVLLLFLGGFIMYLFRLGTSPTYRDEAIKIMEWGVSLLFVLVIILAIQEFLAAHLAVAVSIAAFLVICVVAWGVIVASRPSEKKEEHE